jgi:HK97 gp10 family phage protein
MPEPVILGLKELGDTLDMFAQAVQKRVVRNAARAGARVYRDGMKQRVAKDSGDLEKAITIKDGPLRREGDYKANIGVKYSHKVAASSRTSKWRHAGLAPSTQDPGVYDWWLEFGRPGAHGHTHQAAQPFMRPTFDQDTPKAEQAFIDTVKADAEVGKYIK